MSVNRRVQRFFPHFQVQKCHGEPLRTTCTRQSLCLLDISGMESNSITWVWTPQTGTNTNSSNRSRQTRKKSTSSLCMKKEISLNVCKSTLKWPTPKNTWPLYCSTVFKTKHILEQKKKTLQKIKNKRIDCQQIWAVNQKKCIASSM